MCLDLSFFSLSLFVPWYVYWFVPFLQGNVLLILFTCVFFKMFYEFHYFYCANVLFLLYKIMFHQDICSSWIVVVKHTRVTHFCFTSFYDLLFQYLIEDVFVVVLFRGWKVYHEEEVLIQNKEQAASGLVSEKIRVYHCSITRTGLLRCCHHLLIMP